MNSFDMVALFYWYVVFVFSVILHEAAHAWAAQRGGDLTAYHGGQVSLDPVPHMRREPFGMVILPILSLLIAKWPFGYASAPYDPYWAQRYPRRAAWMALAGPGSNLVLVVASGLLIRAGISGGVFTFPAAVDYTTVAESAQPGPWASAAMLASMLFSLNLILAVLNLIPLPPLDGSGALPLILSPEATERWRQFMQQPMVSWIGIIVAWNLFGPIFHPIFLFSLKLLYPEVSYGMR